MHKKEGENVGCPPLIIFLQAMRKRELYNQVIAYFKEAMPVAETELVYDSPFSLLVAVILSAQCTDKRVNQVTEELFKKYKTPQDFASLDNKTLEKEKDRLRRLIDLLENRIK